jgi:D-hexose-6-phosphate mutarotase
MPRLNWKNILYNIKETREQLEEIERLAAEKNLSETELQIKLEHAYHHLNVAWNSRHSPSKRYTEMSDEDFNEWSKFPAEIEAYKLKS